MCGGLRGRRPSWYVSPTTTVSDPPQPTATYLPYIAFYLLPYLLSQFNSFMTDLQSPSLSISYPPKPTDDLPTNVLGVY